MRNAFYRTLHHIRDRTSVEHACLLERDDKAETRMHSGESTCNVPRAGDAAGSSRPKYGHIDPNTASPLYCTSIRQSKCSDGAENNIAIAKVDKLHPSSPSQNAADFHSMVHLARNCGDNDDGQSVSSPKRLLLAEDGNVQPILHLEVDGGPDENPNHIGTRFLLADMALGGPLRREHLRRKQALSSTREPNGSCKNIVGRMNGCLQQANAGNIYSTGACDDLFDPATGALDQGKVHTMWEHHAENYRLALHGAPGLNAATIVGLHGSVPASSDEAHVVLNRRPLLVEYLANASRKRHVERKAIGPDLANHIESALAFLRHHGATIQW